MSAPRFGVHIYFRPSVGGGERYLFTAAHALAGLGRVDLLCPRPFDPDVVAKAFALDLSPMRMVLHPWRRFHNYRDGIRRPPYDLFLSLENHLDPIQISLGRRGILHVQTPPYPPRSNLPLLPRLKLRSYDRILCNSEYTRRHCERAGTAGVPTDVIAPPIDVRLYTALPKKPVILSVGRFFVGRHEKKHVVLLEAFREAMARGLRGWTLRFAGSVREWRPRDVAYLDDLRRRAEGLPVEFHVGAGLEEIRRLYGEASLYWHATGYGVDEDRHPQQLEHFGMAPAEAMTAGAIPLVVARGGLPEVVRHGEDGFLWETPDDLVAKTLELAASPESSLAELRSRCVRSAARFSRERFEREIRALALRVLGEGS